MQCTEASDAGRWGRKMRRLETMLGVILIVCGGAQGASPRAGTPGRRLPVPHVTGEPTVTVGNPFDGTNSPIMAVWTGFAR